MKVSNIFFLIYICEKFRNYYYFFLFMFFSPLEQYDIIVAYGKLFGLFFIPNIVVPLIIVTIIMYSMVFFFYKDLFILSSF